MRRGHDRGAGTAALLHCYAALCALTGFRSPTLKVSIYSMNNKGATSQLLPPKGNICILAFRSRSTRVNREELDSCLSRSNITSLINLLPSAEHALWVREMTYPGLDFRNPEGSYTLACFKKVCMIERNTNENYRETSPVVSSY